MGKWRQCSKCGAITDPDESHCPSGCYDSIMEIIELTPVKLEELSQKGIVYTKRPAQFWSPNKNPPTG